MFFVHKSLIKFESVGVVVWTPPVINAMRGRVRGNLPVRKIAKGVAMVTVSLVLLKIGLFGAGQRKPSSWNNRGEKFGQLATALREDVVANWTQSPTQQDLSAAWGNLTGPAARLSLPPHNAQRIRRLRGVCHGARAAGRVAKMTSYWRRRSTYCVVPKAACTFWLSLFLFLQPRPGPRRHHHTPLSIPRAKIHRSLRMLQVHSIPSNGSLSRAVNNSFRFMFVRDPYSRLWSSYIDKFFLLDFWALEGSNVARFLNSSRGRQMLGKERHFSPCHSDFSFAEFLTFVTGSGEDAPHELNEHWRPVQHVCDPCLFSPDLVGRVETFQEDSLPVLNRLNLTWVLDSYDHQLHQMRMLSEENFLQVSRRSELARNRTFYSACTSTKDVARRLWTAFQMYGYIPDSYPFPVQELGRMVTRKRFQRVLLQTYRSVPDSVRQTLRGQRDRAMRQAYASVSGEVLDKVAAMYRFEFDAFGYDVRPPR